MPREPKRPRTKRLDFIEDLKRTRGFYEILSTAAAYERGLVDMGQDCRIHEFVVIGTDGHGFERHPTGRFVKFPHYARVLIGDNVEIRSFTTVARGALEDTRIGDGVKIAGNCAIGHGSEIGKHTRISALCVIGGSTIIGDYVDIEMGVKIAPHLSVSRRAHIHAGSMVLSNCKQGTCYQGVPAKAVKRCKHLT